MLKQGGGAGSGYLDLTHVRDVEHARVLAHRLVLSPDPRVLQRHLETRETHELGARGPMVLVQRAAP